MSSQKNYSEVNTMLGCVELNKKMKKEEKDTKPKTDGTGESLRAAFLISTLWRDRNSLTVGFVPLKIAQKIEKNLAEQDPSWKKSDFLKIFPSWPNPEKWQMCWVAKCVEEQLQPHIGIKFNFNFDVSKSYDCDIRVAFDPTAGCWSLLGNQSLMKDDASMSNRESMNFEWLDAPTGSSNKNETDGKGKFTYKGQEFTVPAGLHLNGNDTGATVVHEFGHALGMIHEHQNPFGQPILWDVEKVKRIFSGPPNSWDADTIDSNILGSTEKSLLNGSKFDPDSIMKYSFKKELIYQPKKDKEGKVVEVPDIPKDKITIVPKSDIDKMTKEEFTKLCVDLMDAQAKSVEKVNYVLSETDKRWLGINYPLDGKYLSNEDITKIMNKETNTTDDIKSKTDKDGNDSKQTPSATKAPSVASTKSPTGSPSSSSSDSSDVGVEPHCRFDEEDNLIEGDKDKCITYKDLPWIKIILLVILLCVAAYLLYETLKN